MSGIEFYLPPRFDMEGRRQLWFIRTEGPYDEVVNGILTAFIVFSPLIAARVLL